MQGKGYHLPKHSRYNLKSVKFTQQSGGKEREKPMFSTAKKEPAAPVMLTLIPADDKLNRASMSLNSSALRSYREAREEFKKTRPGNSGQFGILNL